MLLSSRTRRAWLVLGLAVLAVVGLYSFAAHKLYSSRQARRDDDYARAEILLAACWRLPVLANAAALEDELLAVQQGDLAHEESWRGRAVKPSPESVLILEALAKGNLAAFQYNEARTYADAILEREPNHARAFWLRGRAWVRLQQEEQAREDFQRALEIEPGAFAIRLSLAELLHKLGHVREAIAHLERLHDDRPDDEAVLIALAHCWQEQAALDHAKALLERLLARNPHSYAGLVERGRLALRLHEPADAVRWLRQAAALRPDHATANSVLRLALESLEERDEVLDQRIAANERRQAELRLKLHDSGRQPELLTDFGRWVMRTADEREAPGWLYAALKEDPKFSAAHAALAEYFELTGQPRRADFHAHMAGKKLNEPLAVASRIVRTKQKSQGEPAGARTTLSEPTEAMADEVHRLCAACHAYPPPDTMPRASWRKEVKQGYDFLRASKLQGDFPPLENVVLYYENRAPLRLPAIEHPPAPAKPAVKFAKRGTGWMVQLPPYPGVAHVSLGRLLGGPKQEMLLCDTRLDRVLVLKPYESAMGGEALPQVIAPCHAEVTDLDGDGSQDILVASLGNFFPTDDKVGKVVWLRAASDGNFEPVTLLDGVGRVSDVRAADFSGDGRLDLIVAVFGWRTAGGILYLENRTNDWAQPAFKRHIVDARHGAIHVPVVDWNGDARPDFVGLISQEHETVVTYLNQGDDNFLPRTLFTAPHPTYGASGIQVVDLDGDGDHDILLTNGDVLDRPYLLKPYHGVQWLENEGAFPLKHHRLAPMYGASRAVAADFDGDGDMDVAAISFLPRLEFPERESLRLPSVILLEQTATKQFATHVLEAGACDHFSCAAGDWDGDGRIDLAVGNYSWKRSQAFGDAATLWRNVTGQKRE